MGVGQRFFAKSNGAAIAMAFEAKVLLAGGAMARVGCGGRNIIATVVVFGCGYGIRESR